MYRAPLNKSENPQVKTKPLFCLLVLQLPPPGLYRHQNIIAMEQDINYFNHHLLLHFSFASHMRNLFSLPCGFDSRSLKQPQYPQTLINQLDTVCSLVMQSNNLFPLVSLLWKGTNSFHSITILSCFQASILKSAMNFPKQKF